MGKVPLDSLWTDSVKRNARKRLRRKKGKNEVILFWRKS
jgi:hypothetical protein